MALLKQVSDDKVLFRLKIQQEAFRAMESGSVKILSA